MVSNVAQTGENSSAAETNSKKSKKKSGPQYECVITCLDGSVINTSVEKSAKGEELVNKVAQELDVKSKDYVGLLFNNGTRQWLDIHKDMKHQLGDSKAEFLFRVKFYEPEPSKIQEDHLRYLLYLQIREDLSEKRLKCTEEVIAQLGAYTAQAEVGDFNLSEHEHDYLKDYEFAENTDILERINLLHKQHRGQTPLQAELNFLEIAKKIPRYGVDVHDAMDTNGHVEIGIAALGINIYRDGKREQLFRWQNMHDFNYNRRKFTIKLKQPVSDNDNKKNYVYYFESAKSCKQCYKVAVEYHSFFRLTRPDAPRKRADTLKMGSSFRYSDRTLYQLRYQKGDEAPKNAANFKRTPSTRKTLPPSYKTPLIEPEVPFIEPTKVAPLEEEPVHYEEVPVQYEEVEFDEANPDDDNFDPEEWETVEKTMPDGSKKKSRRRVIVLNVVKKPKSGKSPVEEPVQYYEEVEVDEANPDDDKFDPKEWETVENTMPDGSKKKFRRRNIVLNVVKKPKIGKSPVEEPVQYNEEVEFDEANPDDDKYDPEEWETVEKKMPDGSKKKFRRRIIVLNVVKKQKSGKSPVEEEPVQYEQVEVDEANPDDDKFDPKEWETVENTMPDGSKKKFRRRNIVLNVVKKPKSGKSLVEEPVQYYEEVEVDEANPDDDKFDPKEWETVENTMPDGSKKKFRRRNIVLNVVKKPKIGKSPVEEPIQYNEEVEVDEANPDDDKYDPEEWETVEKKMPDGSKKKFRRRTIVLNVVKKPKSGKSPVEEEPVQYEEVEVDEANPDDDKFDPKEWETVEKTMPDGSKKKFRRRIIVLNVVKKPKSGKSPVEEEPVQYEEVEVDEANPDDDKYDPKEWETVEKTMPDGSKKKFRRRIIVLNVVKKPKSGDEEKPSEVDEEPIEYEEVEIDEANPQDDQFDPKEWEVVEKEKPNGDKVRVRRRRVVILKIVKEPEDLVNENEVTVEEMPLNENAPTQEDDDKFDPEEWETIEKMEPDGKVKKYRRRISIVRIVRKSDEEPVDEKDCQVEEVPFDESENDLYDPDEWTEVERTRPDGSVKKYRRRLHVMKIVKNPSPENEDGVNYEEEEITEDNPDDPEKYDPEEWEDLVKTQPDGTVKKYRRRIVVVKYVKPGEKGEEGEKPVGRRPIDEDVIACGEEVVDESSPNFNELLEDPEFEVVHKKRPDGTIVRVKRRAMRVKVSNGKQLVLDECPMEFEETELDEDSQEFIDALDDPESEIIEKKKSDGTIIRVRRRAVNVHVRKPAHTRVTISSHPVRRPSNEDADLSYEEIPVDENSPVHFDKNIWEEYDKVMPDGTTKKYRRRYISKCNVILKKPSFRAEPTPVETSSNLSSDVKYEEVEIGPDDEQDFNKDDWEVIEKEQPDGTKKRFRRRVITTTVMTTYTTTRYVINADGEEDNMMESKPIETTTLTFVDGKPVATSSQDGLDESLSPVEMSMSMDDLISKINQMSTSLEQPAPEKPAPKKNVVTIETITPATTFVVESAPYDEEEARKRQEEERLEQEGLNATIDSIFTLPDDDEVRPLSSRRSTYDEDAYNESFDHELEEYGVEAFPDNTTAETDGIDINLPDPTVRKKKPKTAPKPRRPESFVKMTPTPRSSGSESDDHRMNRTKSDASNEQRDYRPHSQAGDSEIIYTVTDVSMVEQGAGGFVKAVKAKHENLAHEEQSPPTTPKGHVPTRTISFDENDTANVIKTTEPPSVPVEVTTIIPAESELPIEDVIFETNQPQEESFPDMEENIEAMEVPEVETEVILIKQVSNEDVRVAPPNSEPGVVRTRPFSLPRQDTQVIKTEIIEVDLTPSQMESFTEDEGDFVVNTEQLPTEVITKTITIEGDSTEFTQEEIQKLLSQAPEQVGDIGSITSTQVVRMLREAVTSETNQMVTTDEDGNVIITAIQDEIVEVDDDGDDTEV
ncbi:titin-like isoform X2 [Clytia hemisphaerica]|uniref:titin-like isoform X2 n=1 Tax=Clytia hemisphaerica TaxID=252671 RepID=UPI0034D4029F